jgi:hypothetical protein
MADWGLYSALRGTDDWAQKRQDQQMNLLAAEKSEARERQKVAESAAAEADIAKYMEELQNLEVLPEDQERVAQAEKQARQNIVAGIAKNNGDLRRYMSTGGITALNDYKTSVMQSEEVKQAGVNKVNLQNYLTQDAKGNQRHKFVDVDVPMFDEQGNQIGSETKKMSFQDQYDLYKQGKIKQLNYDGSETRINMGIEDFNKMYKNPADPYQEDNYVTASNIYEKMLSKGASDEYAREQANRYADMYAKGGDAWRWKAGDPYELAVKMAKINAAKEKASGKDKGSDRYTTSATLHMMGNIKALPHMGEMSMGLRDRPVFTKQLGLRRNEDTGFLKDTKGLKALDAGEYGMGDGERIEYDLSLAENIEPLGYVAINDKNGNKKYYVKAMASFDDPAQGGSAWNILPFTEQSWWEGQREGTPTSQYGPMAAYNENFWKYNGNQGTVDGEVLIPIQDEMEESYLYSQIDEEINMTQNMHAPPGSPTHEDYLNDITEYYKKGFEANMTVEEIQQAWYDLKAQVERDNANLGK